MLAAALDRMKPPSVIAVDDVHSWPEVQAAWRDAIRDERLSAAGSIGDVGVTLFGPVDLDLQGVPTPVLKLSQAAGWLMTLPVRRRMNQSRARGA